MKNIVWVSFLLLGSLEACGPFTAAEPELIRVPYQSTVTGQERTYFVYLPTQHATSGPLPVLVFLHGNGERGNGKEDLDFVMIHGPLYEAWIRHRDLPFIIVAPQLPYFGREANYADRTRDVIPIRKEGYVPPYPQDYVADRLLTGHAANPDFPEGRTDLPQGWDDTLEDLNAMLDYVLDEYHGDASRVYLTGLSYGGFGTWQWASQNPERFAAIAPVVGWGHPSIMEPIAAANIPVWQFIGGRDKVIEEEFFYPGLNRLEELGHTDVRVTVHADMGHLAWMRVYGGQDLYDWMLSHGN